MLRVQVPYPVPNNSMPLIPWEYLEKHLILPSAKPDEIAEKLTACGLETNLSPKKEDIYLEFTTLTNRIVREIGVLLNCPIKLPTLKTKKDQEKGLVKLNIATNNCSEFHCGLIKNVVIRESSPALKKILSANNIRSINNVVDLANLVMLETGQPFHLLDYDTLSQKTVIEVRQAQKKERMTTISGQKLILNTEDIVVDSDQQIISLAGIVGTKKNAITAHTRNILIECGNFSSSSVKTSVARLDVNTKSSQYFSKEVNLTGQAFSSFHYLISLIQKSNNQTEKKVEITSVYLPAKKKKSPLIPFSENFIKSKIEIISYSLVSEKEKNSPGGDFYRLLFPKSENHCYYRQSLIPSHSKTIAYNLAHGNQDLRLFEIASIYVPTQSETFSEELLTLSATGRIFNQPVHQLIQEVDLFWLKGVLENIFALLLVGEEISFSPVDPKSGPEEKLIEIFLGQKPIANSPPAVPYHPVSNFPASEKDLSLIFAKDVDYNKVIREIKRVGGENLYQVNIFDVYQSPELAQAEKKSVSFRLTFQSATGTLEKSEIEKTITQIVTHLAINGQGALPRDVIAIPALAGGAGMVERHFMCKDCNKNLYHSSEKKNHENHNLLIHPTQKPIQLAEKLIFSRINEYANKWIELIKDNKQRAMNKTITAKAKVLNELAEGMMLIKMNPPFNLYNIDETTETYIKENYSSRPSLPKV
ncbi:21720_t:CDS:2 [Gigaspora margarita]|uniref:21720_t:CDS:1 n=1 Tax=Gigaspora margarita TaxID=4874 RepID=A0ABM8VV96_GIGMA|nr:21720_t:CDS:2 [Gigaspora margarita]